eukprot:2035144-Rhodomonas_salina.15
MREFTDPVAVAARAFAPRVWHAGLPRREGACLRLHCFSPTVSVLFFSFVLSIVSSLLLWYSPFRVFGAGDLPASKNSCDEMCHRISRVKP